MKEFCCCRFEVAVKDHNFTHYFRDPTWNSVEDEDPYHWYMRFYSGEAVGDYSEYYKIIYCPFCGAKL